MDKNSREKITILGQEPVYGHTQIFSDTNKL